MKKHTIKIVVELYYDIENMPDYSTAEGVAKMVYSALDNHGNPVSSAHFDQVLGMRPVDICIESITEA
jgi:hypothetical protein